MHFKAHDCLAGIAAYMNILKRNLSSMCITSQTVAYNIMAVELISEWHC